MYPLATPHLYVCLVPFYLFENKITAMKWVFSGEGLRAGSGETKMVHVPVTKVSRDSGHKHSSTAGLWAFGQVP